MAHVLIALLLVFLFSCCWYWSYWRTLTFRLGVLALYDVTFSFNNKWSLQVTKVSLSFSSRADHWILLSVQGISLTLTTNVMNRKEKNKLKYSKGFMRQRFRHFSAILLQWMLALITRHIKLHMENIKLQLISQEVLYLSLKLDTLQSHSALYVKKPASSDNETQAQSFTWQFGRQYEYYTMKRTQHLFRPKQIQLSVVLSCLQCCVPCLDTSQPILQIDTMTVNPAFDLVYDCMTVVGTRVAAEIGNVEISMARILQLLSTRSQSATFGLLPSQAHHQMDSSGEVQRQSTWISMQVEIVTQHLTITMCNDHSKPTFSSLLALDNIHISTNCCSHKQQRQKRFDATIGSVVYSLTDSNDSDGASKINNDNCLSLLSTSTVSVHADLCFVKSNETHHGEIRVTLQQPLLDVDMCKRHLLASWIQQITHFTRLQYSAKEGNNVINVDNISKNKTPYVTVRTNYFPTLDISLVLLSPKIYFRHPSRAENMQGLWHCASVRWLLSGEYNTDGDNVAREAMCTPGKKHSPPDTATRIHGPTFAYKAVFWLKIEHMHVYHWQHHRWILWITSKHLDLAIEAHLSPPISFSPTLVEYASTKKKGNHGQWSYYLDHMHDLELQATMDSPVLQVCNRTLLTEPLVYWLTLLYPISSLGLSTSSSEEYVDPQHLRQQQDKSKTQAGPPSPLSSSSSSSSSLNQQQGNHYSSIPFYLQLYRRCTVSLSIQQAKLVLIGMDGKKSLDENNSVPPGYLDNTPPLDMVCIIQLSVENLNIELQNKSNGSVDEAATTSATPLPASLGNIRISLQQLVTTQKTISVSSVLVMATAVNGDNNNDGNVDVFDSNALIISIEHDDTDNDEGNDDVEDNCDPTVVVWVSRVQINFGLKYQHKESVLAAVMDTKLRKMAFRYSLANHYACLLAIKALKHLTTSFEQKLSTSGSKAALKTDQKRWIKVNKFQCQIFRVDIHLFLPGEQQVFLRADDLNAYWHDPPIFSQSPSISSSLPHSSENNSMCSLTNLTLFGMSPTVLSGDHGMNDKHSGWETLLELDDIEWLVNRLPAADGNTTTSTVIIMTKAFIRVPYGYTVTPILENSIHLIKAVRELHCRVMASGSGYYTYAGPTARNTPIQLPVVTVQSNQVLICMDDDPFEAKLRTIFNAGKLEQIRRLNLETEFEKEKKRWQDRQQTSSSTSSSMLSSSPSTTTTSTTRALPASLAESKRKLRQRRSSYPSTVKATSWESEWARSQIDTARHRLWEIHSASWIDHIRRYREKETATYYKSRESDYRYRCVVECLNAAYDDGDTGLDDNSRISDFFRVKTNPLPLYAPLAQLTLADIRLTISQRQCDGLFSLDDTKLFIHDVGKGVPVDTDFSFLIPFHLSCQAGKTLVQIRDYPLPLLYVPSTNLKQHNQQQRTLDMHYPFAHSMVWSLNGNYVIADDIGIKEGCRYIDLETVTTSSGHLLYSICIVRTASPVKFYSCVEYSVHTSNMSTTCLSISYQPALQDILEILERLMPANVDPSAKIGFWDKIRLTIHTQTKISFPGSGDFAFVAKGTRDPYLLTGRGAGMAKFWRGNISWCLGGENPQKEFTHIRSDYYILGVPDLVHGGFLPSSSFRPIHDNLPFLKIVVKLTGGVHMGIGCHLERICSLGCDVCHDGLSSQKCRLLHFKPHYQVVYKSKNYIKNGDHDAFAGFRSDFIHLSISIIKLPTNFDNLSQDGDFLKNDKSGQTADYNSMHLSPHFVNHFNRWYGLFGGYLSLPIRRGPVFGHSQTAFDAPVKFGRHLQSLKYKIIIQPMSFAYFYMIDERRESEEDDTQGVDAVGLKINVSHFCLDVHQRRKRQLQKESTSTLSSGRCLGSNLYRNEDELYRVKSDWPLNEVEVQLLEMDLRAVYTTNTSFSPMHKGKDDPITGQSWIDVNDFVELDMDVSPTIIASSAKVLPFAFSPCVNYVKKLDPVYVERNSHLKNTHACVMGTAKGASDTQLEYLYRRLEKVEQQIGLHQQRLHLVEMEATQKVYNVDLTQKANEIIFTISKLNMRRQLLTRRIKKTLNLSTQTQYHQNCSNLINLDSLIASSDTHPSHYDKTLELWEALMGRFKERYTVHNPQIIWTTAVHDIVSRWRDARAEYHIQSYNSSSRITKILHDMVKKYTEIETHQRQQHDQKPSMQQHLRHDSTTKSIPTSTNDPSDSFMAMHLLNELMADRHKNFIVPNETEQKEQQQWRPHTKSVTPHFRQGDSKSTPNDDDNDENDGHVQSCNGDHDGNNPQYQLDQIPEGYGSENMTLIDFWSPQIFLQGDSLQDSGILVANERVQIKQFEIIEVDNPDVDTCTMKKRTVAGMESMQLFVVKSGYMENVELLLDNHYGMKLSTLPNDHIEKKIKVLSAWIPPEMFIDNFISQHQTDRFLPFGSDSSITGTVQYDRYNPIWSPAAYLSGCNPPWDDQCNSTHLHFPNFAFTADPYQYSVLYRVIVDNILYRKESPDVQKSNRLRDITFAIYASGDRPKKILEDIVELQTTIRQYTQQYKDYQQQLALGTNHSLADGVSNNDDSDSIQMTLLQQRCCMIRQKVITHKEALCLLIQSFRQIMAKYHYRYHDSKRKQGDPKEKRRGDDNTFTVNTDHATVDSENRSTAIGKISISVKLLVWKMLQGDGSPFSQWNITNTSYTLISNKDQSLYHTIEVDKLTVENTSSSPVFKQVVGPYIENSLDESSKSLPFPDFSRRKMIYGRLVSLPPVGGIPVIQHLEIDLFPLHLQLTYGFWCTFIMYLFPPPSTNPPSEPNIIVSGQQKSAFSQRQRKSWTPENYSFTTDFSTADTSILFGVRKQASSGKFPFRTDRQQQQQKAGSTNIKRRSWIAMSNSLASLPKFYKSNQTIAGAGDENTAWNAMHNNDDLTIMKQRASKNRTFILIKLPGVKHCLSFKGTRSIYDLKNFEFQQPNLEYRNKTWTWYDLLATLKKDFRKAIIKHSASLIRAKLKPRLLSDHAKTMTPYAGDRDNASRHSYTTEHPVSPNALPITPTLPTRHSMPASTWTESQGPVISQGVIALGIGHWFDHGDDDDGDGESSLDEKLDNSEVEIDNDRNMMGQTDDSDQFYYQYMLDDYLDTRELEITTGDATCRLEGDRKDHDLVSLHSNDENTGTFDQMMQRNNGSLGNNSSNNTPQENESLHGFNRTLYRWLPNSRKGKQKQKADSVTKVDSIYRNGVRDDNFDQIQKGRLLFGKSYRQ